MAWKIYFWIFFIILLAGYTQIFSGTPSVWDALDLMFSAIAVTGLFAYAYKEQIINPKFWSIWFVVIIVWDLLYNLILTKYLGVAQQLEPNANISNIAIIVGFLFLIPEYYALYYLAYRSEKLWNK